MLTNKLSTDKAAFSFGKTNNLGTTTDEKTNSFKLDSSDKSNQRGRNLKKKNENAQSGGVLLTFGLDRENRIKIKNLFPFVFKKLNFYCFLFIYFL